MRLDDILAKAQKQISGGSVEIAIGTVHELDKLRPLPVPDIPADAPQWEDRLTGPVGTFATEAESALYVLFLDKLKLRSDAIAENQRRLRATLWAEAELRKAGRSEAELVACARLCLVLSELVREFNQQEWGIAEPAANGCDFREAVVQSWRQLPEVRAFAPSNTNQQRHLKIVE